MTDDERAEQYPFATYDTRPAKTGHGDDEATLGGRWRTQADAAGWDPGHWLPDTLGKDCVSAEHCQDVAEPATVVEIVAELAEARSTWSQADRRRRPPRVRRTGRARPSPRR